MAGGIEQVDRAAGVIELQHGGGDRDAALLLDFHPVGGDLALFALGLDRPGLLNRPAVEQQLFGEGCLARVRVGDDGEITAPGHRLGQGFAAALGTGGGVGPLGGVCTALGHGASLPGQGVGAPQRVGTIQLPCGDSVETEQVEDFAVLEGFGLEGHHVFEHGAGQLEVFLLDGVDFGAGFHLKNGAFFEA